MTKEEAINIITEKGGYQFEGMVEFHDDRDVLLAAVKDYGYALIYANEKFMNDDEIVEIAVNNFGQVFDRLSDSYKSNKDLIRASCQGEYKSRDPLSKANENILGDKDFVIEIVGINGSAFGFLDKKLRQDKDIALASVQNNGLSLQSASNGIRNNKKIVLAAVKNDGRALEFASEKLLADKSVVLEAVKQNAVSLEFADKSLWKDEELLYYYVVQVKMRFKDYLEWKNFRGYKKPIKITEEMWEKYNAPEKEKTLVELLLDNIEYISVDGDIKY